ncbi:GGDEF domain-containing phosphodiesterase [Alkalicoccus chagannorensis]|uniref:GGDEF domain-containing phosphodiesterase n=1 Tax=Alkalicoccus chagannorensis TaxID=427072 RepID=UPI0004049336|nr:GGDEF domain-containing phosphodiesterase [Alkalicoccus chagannorensis]
MEKEQHVQRLGVVAAMVILLVYLVYQTDGTNTSYLQLTYIPIILSAYYWNIRGGVAAGLIAGLAFGPLMPLSVSAEVMQPVANWVLRLGIFTFIGGFTGYIFSLMHRRKKDALHKSYKNPFTGVYNTKKLFEHLEERIASKTSFDLVSIKLNNIDDIEKYVHRTIRTKVVTQIIGDLTDRFGEGTVYSYGVDELIVVTEPACKRELEELLQQYEHPVQLDGFQFMVSLKIGIYPFEGKDEHPEEVYNKVRIAHEQGGPQQSGLYYYNEYLAEQRREMQEITGGLMEAIRRREFFLVYQPKIDLKQNKVTGAEVLIRWDRGDKKFVAPNVFIEVAEQTGFIDDITKFVLDGATQQIMEWQERGIEVECGINMTAKELANVHFANWVEWIFTEKRIGGSSVEIEITERVFSDKNQELLQSLEGFQHKGFKVSIDDFGTGYNSLMTIGEIPFDILKIDKYFIDRLEQKEIYEMTKNIIRFAHQTDKTVVAEGVEHEAQLDVLRSMGCDQVQGYVYSRPLPAAEFEAFYHAWSGEQTVS